MARMGSPPDNATEINRKMKNIDVVIQSRGTGLDKKPETHQIN